MSINQKSFEILLDDIKLISKSIQIVKEENNPENRKYACSLTEDLVNRLYTDILQLSGKSLEKIKEKHEKNKS